VKILVDENIPTVCVKQLREMGHDIIDVRGTPEEGISDEYLWDKAQQGGRLLITTDRGFARRRYAKHAGMLIVLLRRPNRERIRQRVMETMRLFPPDEWTDLLVIMRDTVMSTWRASAK